MTAAVGFFGKIPGRGDFVRGGLPQHFVLPIDEWWQRVLSESRLSLGEAWVEAWMEAPVWRFAFGPGLCGPDAAVGLWLPSTDRAGRLFPLVLAMTGPRWSDVAQCGAFLDAAEEIGRQTIEGDGGPEAIAVALAAVSVAGGDAAAQPAANQGAWWTDGSPRVAAARRVSRGMPDAVAFAAMLQDGTPL